MGKQQIDISPGHDQTAGFETAQGFGHAYPGHAGEISQHAMGQVHFLQRYHGALTADHAKACSDPVQQMDQPGINRPEPADLEQADGLGHLVMKTGGQLLIRRADFLHTDPCQADSFHGLPLRIQGSNQITGTGQSDRHNIAIQRPGIGADVAIDQSPAEMGRQDAGCIQRELKFFYGQAVDHEPKQRME
ncbi:MULTISPECIES: hypothetical protein [unclassified Synechococcus]|uniref:hypothetical protein n=2 Tax=Synechococcaceae TaxID=1890426 RepID=UPI001F3611CD|nr:MULTISPECIES: hypothetical protein [unclassified Synechococcus]